MKLGSDFRELLTLLNEHDVKYIVVGAHALAAHGFPRNTKDLDIMYEASGENAGRLMDALDVFGFGNVGLSAADFEQRGEVIQLGHPPNRVDLINEISGVEWQEAWNGRTPTQVDGLSFNVLGKAEFIRNKKATGRLADLADIERLGEPVDS